jgi:hypothetical protein
MITDFAITTVNVPDRLDAQEVRARAEAEEHYARPRRRDFRGLRRWVLGIAAAGAVGFAAHGAFGLVSPLWDRLSAAGIATHLSQALGQPVQVANAGLRLTPTPRLEIEGIEVGDQFRIGAVALRFSWSSLAKTIQGAGWVWGEASVGPLELTSDEAFALVRAVPALSAAVPAPITSIRLESVRFRDVGMLPARYQVIAARSSGAGFSELSIAEIESGGQMEMTVSLAAPDAGRFRLRAFQWRPPLGPSFDWAEVAAEGSFAPGRLEVESFSANGFLGVVTGKLSANRSAQWNVHGAVQTTNLDLAAIQREARKRAKLAAESGRGAAIQGVMDASGAFSGHGKTLTSVLEELSATGKLRLRFAALHGVNLGASAVQAGASSRSGGVTRFGDFEAALDVTPSMVRIRDIFGSAGALKVRGTVGVERDFQLGGVLRAEVTTGSVIAPADVRVSGTVFDPIFED